METQYMTQELAQEIRDVLGEAREELSIDMSQLVHFSYRRPDEINPHYDVLRIVSNATAGGNPIAPLFQIQATIGRVRVSTNWDLVGGVEPSELFEQLDELKTNITAFATVLNTLEDFGFTREGAVCPV